MFRTFSIRWRNLLSSFLDPNISAVILDASFASASLPNARRIKVWRSSNAKPGIKIAVLSWYEEQKELAIDLLIYTLLAFACAPIP